MPRLIRSFLCAGRGLALVCIQEPNARWHLFAVLVMSGCGLWLEISRLEWAMVMLAFGAVIAAEALNTAVERLADRVTKERDEAVRTVKDIAAGAVLAASLGAAGAGAFIFGPRLMERLWP